ncbi:MAG TPA: hypothetical protein VFD06_03590 [Candidatus Polarisedimenticolia bacterium]|nr:hypothetical protein [Candidatus Polarisedimenticolia bacterium]
MARARRRGAPPPFLFVNPDIYRFLESASGILVAWSCLFTAITSIRALRRWRQHAGPAPDSAVYTELAGLPLTILQPICFVWAAVTADWRSILLFVWWGPGFVIAAVAVVLAKRRGRAIDWYPYRYAISILCKGYYLAYMAVFLRRSMYGMIFAFSVWIINDQYEKAFLSLDADRVRRTFDDRWLFRIAYPAGLLVPWFAQDMPHRTFALLYGTTLLFLWLAGIHRVARAGLLRRRPADPSLLRNMVYFPRLRR